MKDKYTQKKASVNHIYKIERFCVPLKYERRDTTQRKRKPTRSGRGTNQYKVRGKAKSKTRSSAKKAEAVSKLMGDQSMLAYDHDIPAFVPLELKEFSFGGGYLVLVEYADGLQEWRIADSIGMARNPNTPPKMLEKLSHDFDYKVRADIAKNPNTPVPILEKLAKSEDAYVQKNVLKNPNTPDLVFEQLAKDENQMLRYAVAEKLNSIQLLEKLAKDKDFDGRIMLPYNENLPYKIREELSKDENVEIRRALANSITTPINLLKKLARDDDYSVQLHARTNIKEKNLAKVKSESKK